MNYYKKAIKLYLILCLSIALWTENITPVYAFAATTSPSTSSSATGKSNTSSATTKQKKVSESESLFHYARLIGTKIAKAKFRYGKSNATNFEKSRGRRRSFCADYVTWALQEKGDLSKNLRIYGTRNGNLAGNGRKAILKKYRIIYVRKRTDRVKFKPGDIICNYKLSGRFGWHMMIFARYNKAHHPLWYSGGSDATRRDGYYSKYKLTTPRRLPGYEKKMTAYILRKK